MRTQEETIHKTGGLRRDQPARTLISAFLPLKCEEVGFCCCGCWSRVMG